MRFLLIPTFVDPSKAKANPGFDEGYFNATMQYNEDLYKAGILVASEGLQPASTGAHILFHEGKRKVVDGPYAESKELVAGFWLIDVKSKAEAIEWATRAPINPAGDEVLEIRQLTGSTDIPAEFLEKVRRVAPTWSRSWDKPARN